MGSECRIGQDYLRGAMITNEVFGGGGGGEIDGIKGGALCI